MKKVILAAAIIASFTASAGVNEKWEINQNGVGVVANGDNTKFAIYSGPVEVLDTRSPCNNETGGATWEIDGKFVRMDAYCSAGASRYIAASEAGRKFIVQEFKRKNHVMINGDSFSAAGFSEMAKKYGSMNSNAL